MTTEGVPGLPTKEKALEQIKAGLLLTLTGAAALGIAWIVARIQAASEVEEAAPAGPPIKDINKPPDPNKM